MKLNIINTANSHLENKLLKDTDEPRVNWYRYELLKSNSIIKSAQFVEKSKGFRYQLSQMALNVCTSPACFEKFYSWFNALPNQNKEIVNHCQVVSGYTTLDEQNIPVSACSYLYRGLYLFSSTINYANGLPLVIKAEFTNIHNYYETLLIAASFTGGLANNFWFVQELNKNTLSGKEKRANLVAYIIRLTKQFPYIRNKDIESFYHNFSLVN